MTNEQAELLKKLRDEINKAHADALKTVNKLAKFFDDAGGCVGAPRVRGSPGKCVGGKLGRKRNPNSVASKLFAILSEHGPLTSRQLSEKSGVDAAYVSSCMMTARRRGDVSYEPIGGGGRPVFLYRVAEVEADTNGHATTAVE